MAKKKRFGMKPRALPVISFKELEDYYNNKPIDTGLTNLIFEDIGTEQARDEMGSIAQPPKTAPVAKKEYARTDYLEPVPKRKVGE